ncbi:MAG: hypothetical protein ACYDCK_12395 [Thermoplasmatota archaeon]
MFLPLLALVALATPNMSALVAPDDAALGTTIEFEFPSATVALDTSGHATLTAKVVYTYTAAGAIAPAPTTVHLDVERAPRGLVATIAPATLAFHPSLPVGATSGSETSDVTITLASPGGVAGVVSFLARADANAPNAASEGDAQLRVLGAAVAPAATDAPGATPAGAQPTASAPVPPASAPADGAGIATLNEVRAPDGPSPLVTPTLTALGALAGLGLKRRFG